MQSRIGPLFMLRAISTLQITDRLNAYPEICELKMSKLCRLHARWWLLQASLLSVIANLKFAGHVSSGLHMLADALGQQVLYLPVD